MFGGAGTGEWEPRLSDTKPRRIERPRYRFGPVRDGRISGRPNAYDARNGPGKMKPLMAALTRLLACSPWWGIRTGARVAGWLMSRCGTDMARITKINLSKCFPNLDNQAVDALVQASLVHTASLFFESGALTHWRPERLRRLVVAEAGRHHLDANLNAGGVLLLVPHFGNWEFICFALGRRKFVALYDPPRVQSIETTLRRMRERFGGRLYPTSPSGIRAAYRQLRRGGLVCLLPDQVPPTESGVYAPFFGNSALTATFAHRLIERTRPTVMLGSARRAKNGFELAYEGLGDDVHSPSPQTFALALNRAIEELVRRDPAQYQWEYKRFKRQPGGVPEYYPKYKRR